MFVLIHVDTLNQKRDTKVTGWSRSFVKVAPPTVHAGVGNALRQAFALDGELRSIAQFEDLLARLDDAQEP
jgi:hypothetical protein